MMLEFDTLIPCSEDEALCGRFARMPVADLFCIWDCDVGSWVAGSPLLIRFEEDDLLVEVAGDHAVLTAGAVDTGDASTLPTLCTTVSLQEDAFFSMISSARRAPCHICSPCSSSAGSKAAYSSMSPSR